MFVHVHLLGIYTTVQTQVSRILEVINTFILQGGNKLFKIDSKYSYIVTN